MSLYTGKYCRSYYLILFNTCYLGDEHILFINIKLKLSHYMPWRWLWERRYSSYSFLTSALNWVSGQCHAPGKEPLVPTVQKTGWSPEPVWTQRLEEKSFRFCRGSNLCHPVVQSTATHYTDWATLAPFINIFMFKMWCRCPWLYLGTEWSQWMWEALKTWQVKLHTGLWERRFDTMK
jgi:hypothetical protein